MDGLFGTWFADDDKNDTWLTPTWTLSIELWATFFVYLLAQTVRFYKGREWIYVIAIGSLTFISFTDYKKATSWGLKKFWRHLPLFFMGTAFCDMEFIKGWRPIDNFRNINIWLAILRNIVLLAIFLLYGSLNRYGCYEESDDQCTINNIITIDSYIPYWVALWISALAVFFLALTSEAF
jgi:peptidoglycan/LPS O-acetylase OafA/YrhL